jgi:predicted protein tyrosine phosphatase
MRISALCAEIFSTKDSDKSGLMPAMNNRIFNAQNPYQGAFKKVLCVCSAGLLRSPTAAVVLAAEPFNFNTPCAGIEDSYALIPVDEVLLTWADEIVCMTKQHVTMLQDKMDEVKVLRPIKLLSIPDNYAYRDPELMRLIKKAYEEA